MDDALPKESGTTYEPHFHVELELVLVQLVVLMLTLISYPPLTQPLPPRFLLSQTTTDGNQFRKVCSRSWVIFSAIGVLRGAYRFLAPQHHVKLIDSFSLWCAYRADWLQVLLEPYFLVLSAHTQSPS
jgi:hypothetical protein